MLDDVRRIDCVHCVQHSELDSVTTRWQAGASSFDNHSRTGARVPQDVVLVFADFINGLMILVGSGCKDVPRVQIYDARSLSKEEDRRERVWGG